ncbi:MAG: hypothetical protein LBU15_00480 [Rickettsiales bacterium]|jgi:hypothetical protein|nr:hypothetical protein [Rickettsiales bacterium]
MDIILEIDGEPTLSQDEHGGNPRCRANVVCSGFGIRGSYEGECVCQDNRIILSGRGKCEFLGISSYEGDFKNNKADGCGKFILPNNSCYEGEFRDGKFEGQGKFVYANGEQQWGTWKYGKKDGIIKCLAKTGEFYEFSYCEGREESRSYMSAGFYGKDGLRAEVGADEERRLLWKTETSGAFSSHTDYHIYGVGGGLEKTIRINYNGLNALASKRIASFDELVTGEAILDVTKGVGESEKIRTFGAAKEYLRRAVLQDVENMKQLLGGLLDAGGGDEMINLFQLIHLDTLEQFKFMRFIDPLRDMVGPGFIYINLETFLGALGINAGNLEDIRTNFITLSLETTDSRHSVGLIVNVKRIKELVTQQHRRLSGISESVILCFDSSRAMDYQGNGINLGGIMRYCRFMNQNLQKHGVCWLYAVVATLVAARDPALVERLLAGRIQSYGHGEEIERSGLPNEFEIGVLQMLQEVAAGAGMALVDGCLLSRLVVRDELISGLKIFLDDQTLIFTLEERINIALERTEKERGIKFREEFKMDIKKKGADELSKKIQSLNLETRNTIGDEDMKYILVINRIKELQKSEVETDGFLRKTKCTAVALKRSWWRGLASWFSPIFNVARQIIQFERDVLQLFPGVAAGAGMMAGDQLVSRPVAVDIPVAGPEVFLDDQTLILTLEKRIGAALERTEKECGVKFSGKFKRDTKEDYTERLSREIQDMNYRTKRIQQELGLEENDEDMKGVLALDKIKELQKFETMVNEYLMKVLSRTLASPASGGEQIIIWESVDRPGKKYPTRTKNNPSQSAAGPGQGSEMLEVASQALDHSLGENLSSVLGQL